MGGWNTDVSQNKYLIDCKAECGINLPDDCSTVATDCKAYIPSI